MCKIDNYATACKDATTRQGLDPVIEALSARTVAHFVEQTGGFTMVLTITRADGTWGITHDVNEWLAIWYPGSMWSEGDFVDSSDPTYLAFTGNDVDAFLDQVLEAR